MDNIAGAVDVPCSLFSGLNTELTPSDVPEGVSPDCQDVAFVPGSFQQRPGLHKIFANQTISAVYEKTYVQPNGQPLNLYLGTDGILWREDPVNSPGTISQIGQVAPGSYCQSVTAFGREYMAFSDGFHGTDIPRQYDGFNFDRVSQDGPGAGPTVADSPTAGTISPGVHQCVVMFLTRQGYITAPSIPVSWTAAGGKKVTITNLPIGPSNVVSRIVGFTGAGGGNFFSILANVTIPAVVAATVVPDNTTTSVTLDFDDNSLFSATAIDIPGNNLFAQVVLGPCLGFFGYASRLISWGEYNKVQSFVNMGFDGGYQISGPTNPLGWTVATAGGQIAPKQFGFAWLITGDGTNNQLGMITQTAYRNNLGNAIIQGGANYSFRCWLSHDTGASGTVTAEFFSPTAGSLATASIGVSGTLANGGFVTVPFSSTTPSVIPADTILRIYATAVQNTLRVALDEAEIVLSDNPYFLQARASYIQNPEALDGVTGVFGPDDDTTDIKNLTILRSNLLFKTAQGIHVTQDNAGSEPSGWPFNEITRTVGSLSFRASDAGKFGTGDSGEEWDITASRGGLYIYAGGEVLKISQEIQSDWETINWSAAHALWIKNDSISRRVYVGVPTGTNTSPNKILVMDYRYLESASQIASAGCVRISYTGKMIATDMCRKWTRWNIPALCGEILNRPGNTVQMCVGTSLNAYYFDATNLSDDDYGQIPTYYTTYAFVNGELEQALQLGGHRKLFVYLTLNCSGGGFVKVTPLANTLTNPRQVKGPYPVFANPDHDLEIPLNVATERVFLRFDPQPPASSTDINFQLTKIVLTCKPHPWSVIRGAI